MTKTVSMTATPTSPTTAKVMRSAVLNGFVSSLDISGLHFIRSFPGDTIPPLTDNKKTGRSRINKSSCQMICGKTAALN